MISKSFLSKILILTFVCAAYAQIIINPTRLVTVQSLTVYATWKTQNLRIYLSDDEKIYRQSVFLDNLQIVNDHNAVADRTYDMELTSFADMTEEEFAQKYLTPVLNSPPPPELTVQPVQPIQPINVRDIDIIPIILIPTSFDWRTKGAVTAIKNQGQCGSCWAFSASGAMESFNYIKNKSLKYFSEQQLVDCVNTAHGYGSYGCGGGWPQHAMNYATKYGICQSYEYTYTAVTGSCKVSGPTAGFYPKTYAQVSNNVTSLKLAIVASPVSVVLDASKFYLYGSGIFNSCSATVSLNHAVLAVGYDSSGNWILKNSWGTGWGESGFMRLKGGNSCGILSSNYRITA